MDPKETLRKLKEMIAAKREEEAADFAMYLADWLEKGGFAPEGLRKINVVGLRSRKLRRHLTRINTFVAAQGL